MLVSLDLASDQLDDIQNYYTSTVRILALDIEWNYESKEADSYFSRK